MIDLQQGDCLSLMKNIPDKSIDLLLTDPPYNISKNNNFKTMGRSGLDFGEWDHKFDLISWLSGISRIMNDGSSIIIFTAWRNLGVLDNKLNDEGFIGKDVFRWIKSNQIPCLEIEIEDILLILSLPLLLQTKKVNGYSID